MKSPAFRRGRGRGFTLIEQMICIAILAIVFASGFLQFRGALDFYNHEQDYRLALDLMRRAADQIRAMPAAALPPYAVPSRTTRKAGAMARTLIPGTERVTTVGGKHYLTYDFEVPTADGEAARVDAKPPYAIHLMNAPVRSILDVVRLDAPGRPRLAPRLTFDRALAGAVVKVDYLGAIRVVASCRFFDAARDRQITLRAYDGPDPCPALDVAMVKTR